MTKSMMPIADFLSLKPQDSTAKPRVSENPLIAAYNHGYDEGIKFAATEAQANLEQERLRYTKALETARAEWSEHESDRLASDILRGLTEIQQEIETRLVQILKPFIHEKLLDKAISHLAETTLKFCEANRLLEIRIEGHKDLYEALTQKLGPKLSHSYRESPHASLRIHLDQTLLESRLPLWTELLKERHARSE